MVNDSILNRKGQTDWTMDIPKINYDIDDESDDEDDQDPIHANLQSEEDDDELNHSDMSLIKVEDIALSESSS